MLTVLTPATAHRLTTLAAVLRDLGLEFGADDLFLAAAINQASDTVRAWCGRTFELEAVRETFTSTAANDALMLSRWPVISIEAVTSCGATVSPSLTHADDAGFLHRINADGDPVRWSSGRTIVEYTAGYVLPSDSEPGTLPGGIERATILLVKAAYFARDQNPHTRTESVDGLGTTTYGPEGVASEVERLLRPFRVVVVA